jgi:hypothetical protein
VLSWLSDGYWPAAEEHDDLFVAAEGGWRYAPRRLLASGEVADVHLAVAADESGTTPGRLYLLKVARGPEGNAHLAVEREALVALSSVAGDTTYRHYLPALVDALASAGRRPRRINVFRWDPGFRTLEQAHEQHPALDGRHLAWVFKRLLTVLGFCHRRNVVHGAVLPGHVLIHAPSHGLRLVGWGQSVRAGQRIGAVPARYRDWYPAEVRCQRAAGPATDLFLAARCLVYLAGGDPRANRLPDTVPPPIRRFVETFLLDSASMRPDDAWDLMDDFDEVLRAVYGPPKFDELTLT